MRRMLAAGLMTLALLGSCNTRPSWDDPGFSNSKGPTWADLGYRDKN